MGLDYVDVFYSHRFDPHMPLEETMGADVAALERRDFDDDELAEIDRHATESEIKSLGGVEPGLTSERRHPPLSAAGVAERPPDRPEPREALRRPEGL
jgi:hypothetical protein